jgi:hypothetical protein
MLEKDATLPVGRQVGSALYTNNRMEQICLAAATRHLDGSAYGSQFGAAIYGTLYVGISAYSTVTASRI